jgi:hypothetical protein
LNGLAYHGLVFNLNIKNQESNMKTRRQALIQGASAVAALGLGNLPAFAQAIPETLRIVVGFPPGGTTDAFARRIGEKLRGVYATNIIIENRPGAGLSLIHI